MTIDEGKSQLLIENPINRYLVNTAMASDMTKNSDGSLTIYIQKESPGKDKEANWLPAPDDTAYLVMRLYWPKPATESLSVLSCQPSSRCFDLLFSHTPATQAVHLCIQPTLALFSHDSHLVHWQLFIDMHDIPPNRCLDLLSQ